jgi:hypothetical protein
MVGVRLEGASDIDLLGPRLHDEEPHDVDEFVLVPAERLILVPELGKRRVG